MAEKEKAGFWFSMDSDFKQLVDFVLKIKEETRKDYMTQLIEDDVYRRLSGVPGIEDSLASFDDNFPGSGLLEAYNGLKERVIARGYVSVSADIPAGN